MSSIMVNAHDIKTHKYNIQLSDALYSGIIDHVITVHGFQQFTRDIEDMMYNIISFAISFTDINITRESLHILHKLYDCSYILQILAITEHGTSNFKYMEDFTGISHLKIHNMIIYCNYELWDCICGLINAGG